MPIVKGTHIFDGYLIVDGYSSVDIPTQPDHFANKQYVDSLASAAQPASTLESFTITIDQSVNNPSVFPPITTQAEATARGSFKTMLAAAEALPPLIRHRVVFSLVDGEYSEPSGQVFGDFSKFRFGYGDLFSFPSGYGHIAVTSASGRVRVSGTSTYAVASAVDGTQFTLGSTPFADNTYRGYHIRVVSGTGSGQVKSVRSHVGTTWKVAGRFSPALNSTSVIEVIQAAAWINTDVSFGIWCHGDHTAQSQQLEALQLEEIDIISTFETAFNLIDMSVALKDCRIIGNYIDGKHSFITTNNGIVDGKGFAGFFGLVLISGGYWRAWSSSSSWIIRDSSLHGLRLLGGSQSSLQTCSAHLFEGAIDDNAKSGLVLEGPACTAFNATRFHGTGNGEYGVRLLRNSYYYPRLSDFSSGTEYLRGNLGEVNVDGAVFSYSDISAEPDKVIIGIFNSVADGNQPLVP